MNNIGIGFFCFGEDFYFNGVNEKIINILKTINVKIYVFTDNVHYFDDKQYLTNINIISYNRQIKSYHDKLQPVKTILKENNICILMDADLRIIDYSFLYALIVYNFKEGISYLQTLENHPSKKKKVSELMSKLLDKKEWKRYKLFVNKLLPKFSKLPTIWEYFLVINKNGFNEEMFFNYYEKLQIMKECDDINIGKNICGSAEGVSIAISAELSGTNIEIDHTLYEITKNKIESISRHCISQHL